MRSRNAPASHCPSPAAPKKVRRSSDLKNASIVVAPNLTPQEKQAVTMLQDEIAKRTRITLPIASRAEKGASIFRSEERVHRGRAKSDAAGKTGRHDVAG